MEGESKEKGAEVGRMDIEELGCEKLEVSVFEVSMVERNDKLFRVCIFIIILCHFPNLALIPLSWIPDTPVERESISRRMA